MISIIVAVADNNVIGKDNSLIWHLPADMKFFKEKTNGHCIITGRKNYESIPEKFRPLPNRSNIVITRQSDYAAPGAFVVDSLEAALTEAGPSVRSTDTGEEREVFVIGGGEIYKQSMDIADKLYITRVHATFEGDTFFPEIDATVWKETNRTDCKADEKNKYDYSFIEYEKIKAKKYFIVVETSMGAGGVREPLIKKVPEELHNRIIAAYGDYQEMCDDGHPDLYEEFLGCDDVEVFETFSGENE
jgi:dihydrofolate reductase